MSPVPTATPCASAHACNSSPLTDLPGCSHWTPMKTWQVEQYRPTDDAVAVVADVVLLRTHRTDQSGVVSVPHLRVEEHVSQRIPVCCALCGHDQDIVGGPNALRSARQRPGIRVVPVAHHEAHRVEPAQMPALRSAFAVVDRQRYHAAVADQARRVADHLRGDVVDRARLIVRAPLTPVLAPLCRVAQPLPILLQLGVGDGHCFPLTVSARSRIDAIVLPSTAHSSARSSPSIRTSATGSSLAMSKQ